MANTPDEFPTFSKLDERQLAVMLAKLKFYLRDFELESGLLDIMGDNSTLIDIFDKVEKRRVYFHIFHNRCKMGELNEGALLCFWIIKLMPFFHADIPASELNAKIALYLFNSVITYYAKKHGRKANISDLLYRDLYYSFRFRDISKEAIMALAESMII